MKGGEKEEKEETEYKKAEYTRRYYKELLMTKKSSRFTERQNANVETCGDKMWRCPIKKKDNVEK